jgi:hypothetical protein
MIERQTDISGAMVFWTLQPTPLQAIKEVLEYAGFGGCVPNPRTDQSALHNSIKDVYGTKDKVIVSHKKPRTNGVELVNIERDVSVNNYVTNFSAKVTDGAVKTEYGYADDYKLTEEFLKHKAVLTSGAVGQALSAVIAKMDGMKGFDRSGVYYVPEHWLVRWKELATAVEGCQEGNRITTVRTVIDADAARAIRDVLTKEVQEQASQLLDDVAKGTLNENRLNVRAQQAQELICRIDLYSNILGEGLEGLKNVALLAKSAAAAAVMQDFAQAGVC